MDNMQGCDSYINIPSSQTYRSYSTFELGFLFIYCFVGLPYNSSYFICNVLFFAVVFKLPVISTLLLGIGCMECRWELWIQKVCLLWSL
jgi:hypothetical protein